jgi:hypothetical protein
LLAVHAFLHQLGGLHQVGQEPAAQGQPGQALVVEQLGQAGQQSLAGQVQGEAADAFSQPIPAPWIGLGQLLGAPGQQGRCGQQAEAPAAARIGQGIEETLQARGAGAGEHIAHTHQPTRQAAPLQGQPQGLRLPVFAHEQAEVAGAQGPLFGVDRSVF